MHLKRGRLYSLLLVGCFCGYIWLYHIRTLNSYPDGSSIGVCLFKNVFHIPCPSCGSTRALAALMKGQALESLALNPLAMICAAIMVLAPLWILYDLANRRQTLFNAYNRLELYLRRPLLAMPLILLVLLNWFWNISKGL